MANANPGSKADTAVKLVMIFFICLLSFSVGTYVGKEFSDSDNRRLALEYEYEQSRNPASSEAQNSAAATSPMAREEIRSLAEEFIKEEQSKAKKKPARQAQKESPKETTPDGYTRRTGASSAESKPQTTNQRAAATSSAAERVAKEMAPSKDKDKKRTPSSALPSVASSAVGKFTVQVASYSGEPEARTHAAQLKDQGYSAFYIPAEVNGRTWFRVSIGLFTDQSSAMSYRKELLDNQTVSSAIVQRIVQ